jgi:hypothetical protein
MLTGKVGRKRLRLVPSFRRRRRMTATQTAKVNAQE